MRVCYLQQPNRLAVPFKLMRNPQSFQNPVKIWCALNSEAKGIKSNYVIFCFAISQAMHQAITKKALICLSKSP